MLNNILQVQDPLADRDMQIALVLRASPHPREARPVLLAVGTVGQVPELVAGTLGQFDALLADAWGRFAARPAPAEPLAQAETTLATVAPQADPPTARVQATRTRGQATTARVVAPAPPAPSAVPPAATEDPARASILALF